MKSETAGPDWQALAQVRQFLHQRPEVSGQEMETASFIAEQMKQAGANLVLTGIGGHGVAAVFTGTEPGPTIAFRAELDALPIQETGKWAHCSQHAGTGHMCGHDGHMAILIGVARYLEVEPLRRGRVVLLFQPAEETGAGAIAMTNDHEFKTLAPDFVYALHNLPGLSLGHVRIKPGSMTCASRGMRVRFKGQTTHAATPKDGNSPLNAMIGLAQALENLSSATGDLNDTNGLVTIVHMILGKPAFGIAPGEGEIWATLRTTQDEQMTRLVQQAEAASHEMAVRGGLSFDITYEDVFQTTYNDPDATDDVIAALKSAEVPFGILDAPMRWSEDFGVFGEHAKTALFVLGSGESQKQLHDSDYDFPDALLQEGVKVFSELIRLKLD